MLVFKNYFIIVHEKIQENSIKTINQKLKMVLILLQIFSMFTSIALIVVLKELKKF